MNAAIEFMDTQDWNFIVRYDIISIVMNAEGIKIDHIEDAFY